VTSHLCVCVYVPIVLAFSYCSSKNIFLCVFSNTYSKQNTKIFSKCVVNLWRKSIFRKKVLVVKHINSRTIRTRSSCSSRMNLRKYWQVLGSNNKWFSLTKTYFERFLSSKDILFSSVCNPELLKKSYCCPGINYEISEVNFPKFLQEYLSRSSASFKYKFEFIVFIFFRWFKKSVGRRGGGVVYWKGEKIGKMYFLKF